MSSALAFLDAKYRPKMSPVTIAVSIFALVALVADLIGVNPLRSIWSNFERMEGWLVVIHLWAFYMASTHVFGAGEEGKRVWRWWFNASVVVAFYVACYGIAQLLGWAPSSDGARIDASLGNAAYLAVYMLWNAGLAAYLWASLRARNVGAPTLPYI